MTQFMLPVELTLSMEKRVTTLSMVALVMITFMVVQVTIQFLVIWVITPSMARTAMIR